MVKSCNPTLCPGELGIPSDILPISSNIFTLLDFKLLGVKLTEWTVDNFVGFLRQDTKGSLMSAFQTMLVLTVSNSKHPTVSFSNNN